LLYHPPNDAIVWIAKVHKFLHNKPLPTTINHGGFGGEQRPLQPPLPQLSPQTTHPLVPTATYAKLQSDSSIHWHKQVEYQTGTERQATCYNAEAINADDHGILASHVAIVVQPSLTNIQAPRQLAAMNNYGSLSSQPINTPSTPPTASLYNHTTHHQKHMKTTEKESTTTPNALIDHATLMTDTTPPHRLYGHTDTTCMAICQYIQQTSLVSYPRMLSNTACGNLSQSPTAAVTPISSLWLPTVPTHNATGNMVFDDCSQPVQTTSLSPSYRFDWPAGA